MKHIPLIAIIHDGIHNSVCESQVIEPLKKRLLEHPGRSGYLISFEKKSRSHQAKITALKAIGNAPIELLIAKRTPFLTRHTIYPMILQLRTLLQAFKSYELIARGPIAGYIALRAAQATSCHKLTIQARGLLGHEYRYTHAQAPWYTHAWHAWRAHQFDKLEHIVYSTLDAQYPYIIESVSEELSSYLTKTYATHSQRIIQAQIDIPAPICSQERISLRTHIRTKLGFDKDAYVMCYSGSIKAWQCPKETIALFTENYRQNCNVRLLILTPDVAAFNQLMQQHQTIPPCAYRIACVAPSELITYLSACDAGIVLRTPHIVNWVSRPTKALEYRAAGLDIIHNNTIGMLCSPTSIGDSEQKKSHPYPDGFV